MKFLLALLVVALAACSTVHQRAVEATEPVSYVRPYHLASGGGYVVDDAFLERYNALIAVYGHKKLENGAPVFVPALEKNDGVRAFGSGLWLMTPAAMENMRVLVGLKDRGAPP